MSATAIRAGKAEMELGLKDKLTAALKNTMGFASAKLKAFGEGSVAAGQSMSKMGIKFGEPLKDAVMRYADFGDQVEKMNARTGMGYDAIAKLGYAAEQSGASVETLDKATGKMQQNLSKLNEGNKATTAAFEALGLTQKELAGLSPEQQFMTLAEAISKIENPADRAAAAMEIFGKGGRELLPMFADGAAGITALTDEAGRLGVAMDEEGAENAAKMGDAMAAMSKAADMAKVRIGEALAPAIITALDAIMPYVTAAGQWISEHKEVALVAGYAAAALVAAGGALSTLGIASVGASAALSAVAAVIGTIGGLPVVIAASAAALVAFVPQIRGAFAGLAAMAAQTWEFIDNAAFGYLSNMTGAVANFAAGTGKLFSGLLGDATAAWQGLTDAIAAGDMGLAAEIAMASVKLAFARGMAAIYTPWVEFKTGLVATFDSAITSIRQIWNRVTTWIAEKMLQIMGVIRQAAEMLASIDPTGLAQTVADSLRGIDSEATLNTLREDQTRQRAGLGAARDARDQARATALANALAETEARLAQLAAARNALTAEAATKGTAAREDQRLKSEAEERRRKFSLDEDLFDQEAPTTAGKGPKSAGTFSALAASFLGGPADFAKRTAEAADKTEKHTREIAQNTRQRAVWQG